MRNRKIDDGRKNSPTSRQDRADSSPDIYDIFPGFMEMSAALQAKLILEARTADARSIYSSRFINIDNVDFIRGITCRISFSFVLSIIDIT